ncbi:hypothetical protein [Prauserella shujinwangii]|uniref:hypothetical protein n=1 Tax=Prauserella shujinwangii TaxID=1453103 RepID=UPI0011B228FC|nr:hypothetical protein [Prauserella shujinwangii]
MAEFLAGEKLRASDLDPLEETEARYETDGTVAVDNFNLTNIAFATSIYTTALVTPDLDHKLFTLNRSGLWVFTAGFDFPAATPSGAGNYLLRLVNSAKTITYDDDLQPVDERRMRLGTEYRLTSGTVVVIDANAQTSEASVNVTGFLTLRWVKY